MIEEFILCLTLFCQLGYDIKFDEAMVESNFMRIGHILVYLGRHFLKNFQEVERKMQGLIKLEMS